MSSRGFDLLLCFENQRLPAGNDIVLVVLLVITLFIFKLEVSKSSLYVIYYEPSYQDNRILLIVYLRKEMSACRSSRCNRNVQHEVKKASVTAAEPSNSK